MRTFIAIELDPSLKKTITDALNHFKKLDCQVKWVKPGNIHLTLKFLGELNSENVDLVKSTLEKLTNYVKPFSSTLTTLGAFPSIKRPRIVWIGLSDEEDLIKRLANTIENDLQKFGFAKEERAFKPHITLGRVKSNRNITLLNKELKKYNLPNRVEQSISHLTFFKSTLTPQGPIYEALGNYRFSNEQNV